MREGSLEAAKRLPINWQDADFYNDELLSNELERVFDICHGCRRCVNLCKTFPTLFDLVDNSKTMEVDGVAKSDYNKVIQECYLCDLCYMTKCPYVPPHEWNVDFPHLMLRAKAVLFKKKQIPYRDKILSATDTIAKLASIPVINKIVNYTLKSRMWRILIDKTLAIHQKAELPYYHLKNRLSKKIKLTKKNNAQDKIAIFTTCYGEYNEPNAVIDLVNVLQHNKIDVEIIANTKCCGMPKFEIGDIASVIKFGKQNKILLKNYLSKGFKLTAIVPSCVLMFKNELPSLLPNDKDVADIAKAFFDPFEYLINLKKDNKLNTNFKALNKNILYHIACHQRVQNIGYKTKEFLELIPDIKLNISERCSGHNGVYGVRKNSYNNAVSIAKHSVKKVNENTDYITSDCLLAARHIANLSKEKITVKHPISIVKEAYKIK